jgi:hypothetical protein
MKLGWCALAFAAVASAAFVTSGDARAQEADSGYVTITCDPPAHVSIDTDDVVGDTPLDHFALAPGHHKLKLVSLDGTEKQTLGFKIVAGEEKHINVSM